MSQTNPEIEAVDAELAELRAQEDAVKARLRELTQKRNVLLAHAELAAMPASKREALIIAAQGIATGETFGQPG